MQEFCDIMGRLDDDLQNELVGCFFGWEAARQGKVFYTEYRPGELWHDFDQFRQSTRYRVLAVIPTNEIAGVPRDFDSGKEVALEMYEQLFFTCRGMCCKKLRELLDGSEPFDVDAAFDEIPAVQYEPQDLVPVFRNSAVRDRICLDMQMAGSELALQIIRDSVSRGVRTVEIDRLVSFVVAPYYTPIHEGRQHTPYARDYAYILTWQSDIDYVMSQRRQDTQKVYDWKKEVTGKSYKAEGIHIPVDIPE